MDTVCQNKATGRLACGPHGRAPWSSKTRLQASSAPPEKPSAAPAKAPKLLATAMLLTALAAPAAAQAQAPSRAVAEPDGALEEIIVTARRRAESLGDAPVAVSAFSAEQLARRNIQSTQDLDRITPSLQFATSGQLSGNNSAAVVFIRGVGQIDPTPAVDPGVGIYMDEVYMGRSVGGAMDFRDIRSVEVLRGPQGALFGRNTIGGAVLLKTHEPGDELAGVARARVGEDNLYEGFVAVDLPINARWKSRFSAGFRQRDGYVRRVFDGRDLGDDNTLALNAALRFEPTAAFRLTLRGDFTQEDENGSPFVFAGINARAPVPAIVSVAAGCPGATIPFAPVAPGDPRFGPPNVPLSDDPRCANDLRALNEFTNGGTAAVESTLDHWGLSATAEWDLSRSLVLKSISAVRGTAWTGIRDADNTAFDMLTTAIDSDSQQFSQELQALMDFGRLTGVTGLYYFSEETDDRLSVPLAFPPAPPVIASLLGGGPGTRDLQRVNLRTASYAVFSEWTVDAGESLSVSAGLRYTEDKKTFEGAVLNLFPATRPDPEPLPTRATRAGGPLFITRRAFADTYSALTGSASVLYRLTPMLSTYLSYGTSFKSGGFNTRYNAPTADNLPVPFDKEQVATWEIGVKADLADKLRVNAAAFASQYEDMQLIFRQGVVPLLFNAGSASIDGVEVEFTYLPTAALSIEGGFSYLDDRIDSVTEVPGAAATITPDNALPLTPQWQGNLGLAYTLRPHARLRFTPRLDLAYTGRQFFDTVNTALVAQNEAVTFITAAMTLEDRQRGWQLTLSVDNLSDERFIEQGNASFATLGYAEAIYARPRNVLLAFSIDF